MRAARSTLAACAGAVAIALLTACGGADDEPATGVDVTSREIPSTLTSEPAPPPPPVIEAPVTAYEPPPTTEAYAGPAIGDPCIGAHIGMKATDANGNPIVCDNYMWVPDTGQTPRHPWVDDQREWAECIETHPEGVCREMLNGGTGG